VNAILENIPFGVNLTYTVSTPATLPSPSTALYSAILAGGRSLVLKRTADTNVTVAVIPITIEANQDRTVYAVGGAASSTVTPFITTDTNTAVPSAGTRLRIVNVSPTAAAVDVFITAAAADLSAATPVASNVKNQSASAYFTLAPCRRARPLARAEPPSRSRSMAWRLPVVRHGRSCSRTTTSVARRCARSC
jgi:hypothetical protein